jgi:hypothetical protein
VNDVELAATGRGIPPSFVKVKPEPISPSIVPVTVYVLVTHVTTASSMLLTSIMPTLCATEQVWVGFLG